MEFVELVARAQAGDAAAFTDLFTATQPALLRYLRVRAPQDADDIAAETWLSVVTGLTGFHGDEQGFRSWVFTIARHRLVDMQRWDGRRPATPVAEIADGQQDPAPDAADGALERMGTAWALELIASLPDEQAEAVLLRVVAGLDAARVGQIMGRSAGSVRVLTHRGLKALAGKIPALDPSEL